ncbi:hypothetical protein B0T10DRAFT_596036 [Thelonectria olida]|uniref:Uncharacterized protein n=1 Tax=Thelonectria olida TaxID=1576542 RepID=A0A9P8VMJ7_9HYPO|nr:hypothetical protein B0T10DRAFT_596036 [Thelonectria olida]
MLKKLGGKSPLIHLYSNLSSAKAEKQVCFEILVALTNFFADDVQCLRQVGNISRISPLVVPNSKNLYPEPADKDVGKDHNSWQMLLDIFAAVEKKIDDSLAQIYRIECCADIKGDVDAALKHIQDAMAIPDIRKDIIVGEHARCLFKLSEILYQIPGKPKDGQEVGLSVVMGVQDDVVDTIVSACLYVAAE